MKSRFQWEKLECFSKIPRYCAFAKILNNMAYFSSFAGWKYLDRNDIMCKATPYLRRSGKTCSAVLTLLLTVERYLCIAHPFKAGLRSKKVAMAAVVISFVVSFSLPAPLIPLDMVYNFLGMCYIDMTKVNFYDNYDLVAIRIFGEGVVGIVIFLFTCLTIIGLFRARKRSKQIGTSAETQKFRNAQDAQINNMLLVIVFMFFLTRLPYTVAYFMYNQNVFLSAEEVRYLWVCITISRAFATLNYSTNFIIYIVFVRTFRSNLTGLCARDVRRRESARDVSRMTPTTSITTITASLEKLKNHL